MGRRRRRSSTRHASASQRTELVHDLPGGAARLIQRPIGIEHVIVNGEPLVERGVQTDARSGQVLRAQTYAGMLP